MVFGELTQITKNTLWFAVGLALAVQGVARAQDQGRPVINPDSVACSSGEPEKMVPACTRIVQGKGRTPAWRNRCARRGLRSGFDVGDIRKFRFTVTSDGTAPK